MGADCHLYLNHGELVEAQLARTPRAFPTLELAPAASMFDYRFEDFAVAGYEPHAHIAAAVAV
jgi:thymidylate synthase